MQKTQVDYIILGAGCAGLGMAVELHNTFPEASIALIDTRKNYTRDHTWCFWQMDPDAWYIPAISYQWNDWSVIDSHRQQHYQIAKYPYVHINALDYYALAQKILENTKVKWLFDTNVIDITHHEDFIDIATPNASLRGKYLFDSRPPNFNVSAEKNFLMQCFRGWHIKTRQGCFNPNRVTLMDFRLPQHQQIHFMYILPFSTTEALVEPTFFLNTAEDSADVVYEQSLTHYLKDHYHLTEYTILHKEQGCLPMINKEFNRQPQSRWYMIGSAAGLLRPSTGYGFCGIQRYNQKLAASLKKHRLPAPPLPYSSTSQWMDNLLLKVLHAEPAKGAALLMQIFTEAPAASVIRFLSDAATYPDLWHMLNAVPRYQFLQQYLINR